MRCYVLTLQGLRSGADIAWFENQNDRDFALATVMPDGAGLVDIWSGATYDASREYAELSSH